MGLLLDYMKLKDNYIPVHVNDWRNLFEVKIKSDKEYVAEIEMSIMSISIFEKSLILTINECFKEGFDIKKSITELFNDKPSVVFTKLDRSGNILEIKQFDNCYIDDMSELTYDYLQNDFNAVQQLIVILKF